MTYPGVSKTILIGTESSWGTGGTADKDVGLVQDVSDNLSRDVKESLGIGAIDTQKVTSGIVDIGASITVEFQHGRLLEYIIGSVGHQETTSDWKHTFTVSSTPPSFIMESANNLTTDTVLTGTGFLVESGELSIALNDTVKLKVDVKGKTTTSSTSAAVAVLSTLIVYPHALVDIKINNASATEVQNFSIKAVKKVERSGGMKSNLFQQGHGTELRFEFSGTLGFQDETFQELFLGGSTPSATSDPTVYDILFNATNGTTLGSGRREIYWELENCIMDKFDEVASIGNLIFVDISGKGTLKSCFSVDDISDTSW